MTQFERENRDETLATSAFTLACVLVGKGPTKAALPLGRQLRDYFFHCAAATRPLALLGRSVAAALRLQWVAEWKLYVSQRKVLKLAQATSPDMQELWGAIQAERNALERFLLGTARSPVAMTVLRCGIRDGIDPYELIQLFRTGQIWIDPNNRKLEAWRHRPKLLACVTGLITGTWIMTIGLAMLIKQQVDIDIVGSFVTSGVALAMWVSYWLFKLLRKQQELIEKTVRAYERRVIAGEFTS